MTQPLPITLANLSEQLLRQIPVVDGIPASTTSSFPTGFPKITVHFLERLQQSPLLVEIILRSLLFNTICLIWGFCN